MFVSACLCERSAESSSSRRSRRPRSWSMHKRQWSEGKRRNGLMVGSGRRREGFWGREDGTPGIVCLSSVCESNRESSSLHQHSVAGGDRSDVNCAVCTLLVALCSFLPATLCVCVWNLVPSCLLSTVCKASVRPGRDKCLCVSGEVRDGRGWGGEVCKRCSRR